MLEEILSAVRSIRAPISTAEYDLHALVARALAQNGLPAAHEAALGPRCRIDFLCKDVGIEIKRAKPQRAALLKQLQRYLSFDALSALVLVSEHTIDLPEKINGKTVCQICLQKLWGIASVGQGDAPSAPAPVPPAEPPQTVLESPAPAPSPLLPAYLWDAPTQGHVYGTLSYNKKSKCWTVKGEPCVTEICKRLFPGTAMGNRRGEARFTAHRRVIGDINWLMLRYPLSVAPADAERWEKALSDARGYAIERENARLAPQFMQPPAGSFQGELKPFQQSGLAFLCSNTHLLLADEMGLGKTIQALACLAKLSAFPALVIVPPHLVLNWQSEIERFLRIEGRTPRVYIVKGLKPQKLPDADIYLMHYLLLRGWKEILPSLPFAAVIFDEVQELRHSGTEKYSAASLVAQSCARVIGLSGTPIYNQGGEIWNVVNILDYHFLGDWESFSREWCYGYGSNIVIKPDLLGDYLRREGLMLRRTKKEVLPELPDKRRLVQEIDADDAIYKKLMQPVMQNIERWRNEQDMKPSERALLEDRISQDERQATGIAKAPYVCQFVRALLESGEKVLLFAHHHAVMDIYKRELSAFKPAFITGRETPQKKAQSVDNFMMEKTNLCCISLRAASGLNLQRATCVVFGELDWSPAVHSQAEDRAHRIGQKDSLLCYYLVSPRGSDADIQEALGLKVSQFLGLMGDHPVSAQTEENDAGIARRHVEKLVHQLYG